MRKEFNYAASMYIGETIHGAHIPVFYDLHTCIFNNKPPGCLITGAPGSGKTFLALTLTCMSVISGKTTVVLDPKGDFLCLSNLKEELGNVAIWNLANSKAGLLDPFYMASDKNEKLTLCLEVINIFVGGLSSAQRTAISPIIKDAVEETNPSLQKVVQALRGSENTTARELGTELDLISRNSFAKLCFAPGNKARSAVAIDKGLTIITLVGLELPLAGETASRDGQRLAVGIMFLITNFLKRIMMADVTQSPKTVVIDEAHAVISTDIGGRAVKELALLGRSRNLALVLITQNTSHIEHLDVETTLSTRFAFRTKGDEARQIIKDMNLPENEGFENILLGLDNGQCLMADFMNRFAVVQISRWNDKWKTAFNNNPLELAKQKKAEEQNVNMKKVDIQK